METPVVILLPLGQVVTGVRGKKIIGILLGVLTLSIYFYWQTKSIYGGDAGDLVAAAYLKGVAHPPGYPLYTFLGYLLTRVPYSTVAARVGLLSVIPSALAIVVLYFLILRIAKASQGNTSRILQPFGFKIFNPKGFPAEVKELASDDFASSHPRGVKAHLGGGTALIACLTLAFSYLFWLYAEVPEVFGLYSLFVVSLTYILFTWSEKKDNRFLYLFSFLFGLSLCHHHIILFLVPAFLYWIYTHRKILPKNKFLFSVFCFLFFVIGLLPYLYVYFAAKGNPAMNWDNPVNLKNFIRLITRAAYGTFVSGPFYSQVFLTRFVQFFAFFASLVIDFTWLGVILMILGAFWEFRKRRKFFIFNLLAILFSGPLFLFYASFPLVNNFTLASFERFLLPSYLFLTIWLAEGIVCFSEIIVRACRELFTSRLCPDESGLHSKNIGSLLLLFSEAIFLLLPLSFFFANFPKISILKNDFTAEHLAEDILNNLPQNSILILSSDTPLFNTQYLYFTQEKRQDVKFFHFSKLNDLDYQKWMKKTHPEVKIPQGVDCQKAFTEFIELNSQFPIYSNIDISVSQDYVWVPEGLVKRVYLRKEAPSAEEFLVKSQEIWEKLHDPLDGSLSQYKNLMLADVLRVYSWERKETGKVLLKAEFFEPAENFFQEAIKLNPEDKENYQFLGQAFLGQEKCFAAQRSFERAVEIDENDENNYLLLSKTYQYCFKDGEKAKEYEVIYQEKKKQKEIPIEEL